jgi:hypothetical protein
MKQDFWKMTVLGIGALLASTSLSQAQETCGPRDLVIERLTSTYGETRQSLGLGRNNAMVEVFASTDTGTWTITVTTANGVTCLVASGQAFERLVKTQAVPLEDA